MRDFFIEWFEKVVSVIVVVAAIGVVVAAIAALFQQGFLAFLAVLIFGALYVVLMGGAMFLGLGIYQNTKRSADLLERLALK
ncbi:MAG: hypothetical protein QM656_12165 [Paracoccaceae bacterium]